MVEGSVCDHAQHLLSQHPDSSASPVTLCLSVVVSRAWLRHTDHDVPTCWLRLSSEKSSRFCPFCTCDTFHVVCVGMFTLAAQLFLLIRAATFSGSHTVSLLGHVFFVQLFMKGSRWQPWRAAVVLVVTTRATALAALLHRCGDGLGKANTAPRRQNTAKAPKLFLLSCEEELGCTRSRAQQCTVEQKDIPAIGALVLQTVEHLLEVRGVQEVLPRRALDAKRPTRKEDEAASFASSKAPSRSCTEKEEGEVSVVTGGTIFVGDDLSVRAAVD